MSCTYQSDLIWFGYASTKNWMSANEMELLIWFGHIIYDSFLSNIVQLFLIKLNLYKLSTEFNTILANSPGFWLGLKYIRDSCDALHATWQPTDDCHRLENVKRGARSKHMWSLINRMWLIHSIQADNILAAYMKLLDMWLIPLT